MPSSTSRSGIPPSCTLDFVVNPNSAPLTKDQGPAAPIEPISSTSPNTTNDRFFLDIPLTSIYLLSEHFSGRCSTLRLVKTKRDKRFLDIGDVSLTTLMLAEPEDTTQTVSSQSFLTVDLSLPKIKTNHIEISARNVKKKLLPYLSQPPATVHFVVDGVAKRIRNTKPKTQVDPKMSHYNNHSPKSTSPKVSHANLIRYFRLNFHCTAKPDKVTRRKVLAPSKFQAKLGKLGGGMSPQKIINFEFFTKPEPLDQFQKIHSYAYLPDLYKMRAINSWQTGKLDDCMYYLSMAKGKFIEAEIIDKHCGYLARIEESHGANASPDQCIKKKIFKLQNKDLLDFQESKESLRASVESIDKAWNVVEITTDLHHYNRFGNNMIESKHTPGVFITAHVSIPGSTVRHSYVTYVPKPNSEPGVNKSVLEEFTKVMHKNRLINEGFQGDRKKYWETRKEHNEHLLSIVENIQENWIFPWAFLLVGNIPTPKVITKIKGCLRSIETMVGAIKPMVKGVLYKLIENYNIIPQRRSKEFVPRLLTHLFNDDLKSKLDQVTQKIVQVGSSIDCSVNRKPTILVLDQGIDQLPWEMLPILQNTPITRVPSITLIQSLMNIHKKHPNKGFDTKNCFYLLNPDKTLPAVEQRLKNYFESRPTWFGVTGDPPTMEQIEDAIQKKGVYLYCGHGCGSNYISECVLTKLVCNSIPLLMGCGSLKFVSQGPRSGAMSTVVSYFSSACVSMVGYLWEITDLECDRMTVDLIERFMGVSEDMPPEIQEFDGKNTREKEHCLPSAVLLCREAPTQYLTKAAVVNYGIPVMSKLW